MEDIRREPDEVRRGDELSVLVVDGTVEARARGLLIPNSRRRRCGRWMPSQATHPCHGRDEDTRLALPRRHETTVGQQGSHEGVVLVEANTHWATTAVVVQSATLSSTQPTNRSQSTRRARGPASLRWTGRFEASQQGIHVASAPDGTGIPGDTPLCFEGWHSRKARVISMSRAGPLEQAGARHPVD
jgi:hypothetical protein